MRRLVLVTVTAMCLGTFPSSNAVAQVSLKSSDQPLYENHAYGFRVKLPPGVTYTRTLPPNPDHGFGVSLLDRGKLWVDASYTDSSSTDEEAKTQSAVCRVEETRPTGLGSRPAVALRFSCPASADGEAYWELLVLTVYQEGNRSRVDYQIGMRTDVRGLSQNRELFDKLVTGFSFEK
jgi:hypothetical protein